MKIYQQQIFQLPETHSAKNWRMDHPYLESFRNHCCLPSRQKIVTENFYCLLAITSLSIRSRHCSCTFTFFRCVCPIFINMCKIAGVFISSGTVRRLRFIMHSNNGAICERCGCALALSLLGQIHRLFYQPRVSAWLACAIPKYHLQKSLNFGIAFLSHLFSYREESSNVTTNM